MDADAAKINYLDWSPKIFCELRTCLTRRAHAAWILYSRCRNSRPRLVCEPCHVRFMAFHGSAEVECRACGYRGLMRDHVVFEGL